MKICRIFITLVIISIVLSCGQKQASDEKTESKDYLPTSIESAALDRTSEVKTYEGESLYEYINGGAEVYHQYGFVEVSMAYYQLKDSTEFVLDVYQFDTSEGAYGLYSSLKYDEAELLPYGVEGYISSGRLEFVKDKYIIRITGYDNSSNDVLMNMAEFMNGQIKGSEQLPKAFSWFPEGEQFPNRKIFSDSYLGIKELTNVYTVDYLLDGDTITLFITDDESGNKFLSWSNQLSEMNAKKENVIGYPYDENLGVRFDHSYYGKIIFGLKSGKLAGIVNYSEKDKDFLAAWLTKLPE